MQESAEKLYCPLRLRACIGSKSILIKAGFTLLLLPKSLMENEGGEPILILDGLSEVIMSTSRLPPNIRNDMYPLLHAYFFLK